MVNQLELACATFTCFVHRVTKDVQPKSQQPIMLPSGRKKGGGLPPKKESGFNVRLGLVVLARLYQKSGSRGTHRYRRGVGRAFFVCFPYGRVLRVHCRENANWRLTQSMGQITSRRHSRRNSLSNIWKILLATTSLPSSDKWALSMYNVFVLLPSMSEMLKKWGGDAATRASLVNR